MVAEFLISLETLEDVVTSFEIFERSEYCAFKFRHRSIALVLSVEDLGQTLEPQINQLGVFITEFT